MNNMDEDNGLYNMMTSTDSTFSSLSILEDDNTTTARNRTIRWVSTADFYNLLRPIISLCLGVVGLPSIVLLMLVMLTPRYRRLSFTLYLTIMGGYDFIFILIETIESILRITLGDKYIRNFLVWDIPCKLFEHVYYTSMTVSMWLNVAVAVDRFVVIAFPFKKDAWCNRRNSWIVSGSVMIVVHCAGIVYYINGKVVYIPVLDIGYICSREDILFNLDVYMNYLGGVVSAMMVICLFTIMSVSKLTIIQKKRLEMTSNQPISTKDKTSRATIALIAIGVSAFVTQMPYITNEMIRLYAKNHDRQLYLTLWFRYIPGYKVAVQIFEGLSFFINIQNFFFLFVLNGSFRRDVISMLTCQMVGKRRHKPTNQASTIATATAD